MADAKFAFYKESDGSLQYHSDFMTQTFLRKDVYYTVATSGDGYSASGLMIPTSITNQEVWAYRSSATVGRWGTYFINNSWFERVIVDGPPGTLVEVYVFARIRQTDDRGVGFRAWNSVTNELAFSTRTRPMIVAGRLEGSSGAVGLQNDRKYAAVLPTYAGRRQVLWDQNQNVDNDQKIPRYYYTGYMLNTFYGVSLPVGGAYVVKLPTADAPLITYTARNDPPPAGGIEVDVNFQRALVVDVTGL